MKRPFRMVLSALEGTLPDADEFFERCYEATVKPWPHASMDVLLDVFEEVVLEAVAAGRLTQAYGQTCTDYVARKRALRARSVREFMSAMNEAAEVAYEKMLEEEWNQNFGNASNN